jgi:hypothetical protein
MQRSMMLLPSFALLLLVGCATEPRSGTVFFSDGDSLNPSLSFSLGPEKEGPSAGFRGIGFYPLFRHLP